MAEKLSETLRSALLAADNRTGRVESATGFKELKDAGYATEAGNLTRKGRIARQRALSQALEVFDA